MNSTKDTDAAEAFRFLFDLYTAMQSVVNQLYPDLPQEEKDRLTREAATAMLKPVDPTKG